jgi:hypothetical protein
LRDFGAAGPPHCSEPSRLIKPLPKGRRLTRQARKTCSGSSITPGLALSIPLV